MLGLIVPHRNSKNINLKKYVVPVDKIEFLTGLNFNHKILNVEEDVYEKQKILFTVD